MKREFHLKITITSKKRILMKLCFFCILRFAILIRILHHLVVGFLLVVQKNRKINFMYKKKTYIMVPIILIIYIGINTGRTVHITLIIGIMVPMNSFLFYTKRIVLVIIEAIKALVIVSLTGVSLFFGT